MSKQFDLATSSIPTSPERAGADGGKSAVKLSVPPAASLPRALTEAETTATIQVGDALIPRSGPNPAFSELEDRDRLLNTALTALAEYFDDIVAALPRFTATLDASETLSLLRELEQSEAAQFFALSSVVCGCYFMSPQVRKLIGIPGLEPHPPLITAAADDLEDGILNQVIAKGATFTPTDDCPR